MKEIEILFKLNSEVKDTAEILKKYGAVFEAESETVDTYFTRDDLKSLQPDENNRLRNCLRLRKKGEKQYITYKQDHFDNNDVWLYSDEFETTIGDINTLENILKILGFKELIVIDNIKTIFKTEKYEIAIESVKGLGDFIEIEYHGADNIKSHEEVESVKQDIRQYIKSLGIDIGKELNAGKPELMLSKINNK